MKAQWIATVLKHLTKTPRIFKIKVNTMRRKCAYRVDAPLQGVYVMAPPF